MMLQHSMSSASLMTRGGANLMMSPCVGLAKRPRSLRPRHTYTHHVQQTDTEATFLVQQTVTLLV